MRLIHAVNLWTPLPSTHSTIDPETATRPETGASGLGEGTYPGEVVNLTITPSTWTHRSGLRRGLLFLLAFRAHKSRLAMALQFQKALLQHPQVQA